MNKILSKQFLASLLYKQNKWHKHGVFVHTMRVTYYCIKGGDYRFVVAGLLHDVGKPYSAYQDQSDVIEGTYSFTNHEELSYQIIKKWSFISSYSKELVRYHYLIRDMKKSKQKGKTARHQRLQRIWNRLDEGFKEDLARFLTYDDQGKGKV
jgi:HD superfamily phosphohydrolase